MAKNSTKKSNKKETKNENKTKKKEEVRTLKKVYLVDYYIKDLTTNKFLETNIPDKINPNVNDKVVIFKGKKPILEGMKNLFPKVEEFIINAKEGEEKTIKLSPIDAYGLRNKDLLRIVPMSAFTQNKINPFVGLTIEAEGMYGRVKSVSGGRVLVDFNSPYADHEIEVYVKKLKTCNEKEAIETILENFFTKTNAKLKAFENEKITIELNLSEEINIETYKQIIGGFLKNFVKYKELVVEAKKDKAKE